MSDPKGCKVCSAKPAIYAAGADVFCAKHKAEAVAAQNKQWLRATAAAIRAETNVACR